MNKNVASVPRFKALDGPGNKMMLFRHRTRKTGLADQSYFLVVILSRHVLNSMIVCIDKERPRTVT